MLFDRRAGVAQLLHRWPSVRVFLDVRSRRGRRRRGRWFLHRPRFCGSCSFHNSVERPVSGRVEERPARSQGR